MSVMSREVRLCLRGPKSRRTAPGVDGICLASYPGFRPSIYGTSFYSMPAGRHIPSTLETCVVDADSEGPRSRRDEV